jgi:hypothetical protein
MSHFARTKKAKAASQQRARERRHAQQRRNTEVLKSESRIYCMHDSKTPRINPTVKNATKTENKKQCSLMINKNNTKAQIMVCVRRINDENKSQKIPISSNLLRQAFA